MVDPGSSGQSTLSQPRLITDVADLSAVDTERKIPRKIPVQKSDQSRWSLNRKCEVQSVLKLEDDVRLVFKFHDVGLARIALLVV